MDLAHQQAPAPEPARVDLAELSVAVPVRMLLQVLEMAPSRAHASSSYRGTVARIQDADVLAAPQRSAIYEIPLIDVEGL